MLGQLSFKVLYCPVSISSAKRLRYNKAHLLEDILRFVSFVNWHLTLLLTHSEQLADSVASHCHHGRFGSYHKPSKELTFTFRSLQESQLGSFLLDLKVLLWGALSGWEYEDGGPGVR